MIPTYAFIPQDKDKFADIISTAFSRPDLIDVLRMTHQGLIRGVSQRPRTKRYSEAQEAEFVTYLYELFTGPLTKWVLPDVTIGDGEYQVDIVSIEVHEDSLLVRFIECTINDGVEKRNKDARKLAKLIERLQYINNLKIETVVIGMSPGQVSHEYLLKDLLTTHN